MAVLTCDPQANSLWGFWAPLQQHWLEITPKQVEEGCSLKHYAVLSETLHGMVRS